VKTAISIDMDNYEDYRSLIDPEGDPSGPSFYQAVPRFLDMLDGAGVRATFFVIGRDATRPEHRPILQEIAKRGHEIGNHSYTHPYDFRRLSREGKGTEIARTEDAISDALGERPVGFRAPSGDVDRETHEILEERGYLYDSSLTPSLLMWGFMLYGKLFIKHQSYQLGLPAYALAPPYPYLPRADKIHRRRLPDPSQGPHLVEIPTTVIQWAGMPFYSTLMRRLGTWSFDLLARVHPRSRPLHMLFHALDLVDLGGTSLGEAMARSPGLNVPLAQRERFVSHVFQRLAGLGDAVTLSELARDCLDRHGLLNAA
jgi:peptidoglycan/xylan/chitin deacetylase (PgdA/CDA1 family)